MNALPPNAAVEVRETALSFECVATPAVAILHRPARPTAIGVAVVVGGPQYRVGGHRQFVDLARDLAASGIPVFRFDYRGIGDSQADHPGFTRIAPDIEAGLAAFRKAMPELKGVVLWALCDGVPASAWVAARTPWVVGVAALNPWIREPATHERTLLRHYYLKRPLQRDFWVNLLGGRLHARDFASLAGRSLRRAAGGRSRYAENPDSAMETGLAARLVHDFESASAQVLILLSGQDLTAREFEDAVRDLPAWRRLSEGPRLRIVRLPTADHTCAGTNAHAASVTATLAWLAELPGIAPGVTPASPKASAPPAPKTEPQGATHDRDAAAAR